MAKAATKTQDITRTFDLTFSKSTAGTNVYRSDEDDCIAPSIYVKKHWNKEAPKGIRVTIEPIW